MKKIILGLCATLFFGFAGQAQNNTYSKSAMVVLVSQAKSTYTKGMTYKEWVNVLTGNTNSTIPTAQEDKLLKDVYGFVSTNANPETISKNYNGQSLLDLAKSKGNTGVLSTSSGRCGFWCDLLSAMLHALFQWLAENPPLLFP
jgi:hypothetical protein